MFLDEQYESYIATEDLGATKTDKKINFQELKDKIDEKVRI
jgi:hypothetical protein